MEHYLLGRDIRYRTAAITLYAGEMEVPAAVLIFERDGYDVHLTLLSPRDLRLALKISPGGKPIERAKADTVESLLAAR